MEKMSAFAAVARKTDLHPFHFRDRLPFGGDMDSSLSAREIVDWAERFGVFERFVLGSHSPRFFQIQSDLSPEEYLDGIKSRAAQVRPLFSGRIFLGIECDLKVGKGGKAGFAPGDELLSRFDPEVALIGLHFHRSLTYAGLYETEVGDLGAALFWAVEDGRFAIIAHPFDPLERVWREDRESFERIANRAREQKVAFEINADKGISPEVFIALMENGNLFSFGSDLHSLSHWLKREEAGIEVPKEDQPLVEGVLRLNREATDFEKGYWRKMDRLISQLPHARSRRWQIKKNATLAYRHPLHKLEFQNKLREIVSHFSSADQNWIAEGLWKLWRIYERWGGEVSLEERRKLEKYLSSAPLTAGEESVLGRHLEQALELGLKKDQLVNSWEDDRLEPFLKR